MAIFGFLKKKPQTESMDSLVDEKKSISEESKIKARIEVLKEQNTKKKQMLELQNEERTLQRENKSYSGFGQLMGGMKNTFNEGVPRIQKSFKGMGKNVKGIQHGVRENVNLDYVNDLSNNPFSMKMPHERQQKSVMVKTGKNSYVKVKLPKQKQKQQQYNPYGMGSLGFADGFGGTNKAKKGGNNPFNI